MRIESFWAKGFRSLRDVRIDSLSPINVFYGPNGSGKSNLLAAMQAWLRLLPIAFNSFTIPLAAGVARPMDPLELVRGREAYRDTGDSPLTADDFTKPSERPRVVLGGALGDLDFAARVEVELELDATAPGRPVLLRRFATVDGLELEHDIQRTNEQLAKAAALESTAWGTAFGLIGADRIPRTDTPSDRPTAGEDALSWYFRHSRLKDAFFAAQNAASPTTVRALDRFRELMAGPPLFRPPFRVVEDPHTGVRDLRERLAPPLTDHEVSLDFAGLGIAQVYWILGQAMLSGARLVGIEEPEAHLHAPTTGLHLRQLLGRLVREKHVDQLFLATHSNLFDLDPTGFFDLRLENGETIVCKRPLDDVDEHLYEPGPTLHALEELLSIVPEDKVMFRRPDRSPVTAREMVTLLRDADPTALEYLRNLHAAAVDVVGLRSRRGGAS